MSLFHQKKATERQMISTPTVCPECTQKTLNYRKGEFKTANNRTIKGLDVLYCEHCRNTFYDDAAVGDIERLVHKQPLKKAG